MKRLDLQLLLVGSSLVLASLLRVPYTQQLTSEQTIVIVVGALSMLVLRIGQQRN